MIGRRGEYFITFGAIRSAFYFWINKEFIGYNQDSKTEIEFDLTHSLVEGENDLTVQVFRSSDGSYLECQDMWRMSGIERDVFLWSVPEVFSTDYKLMPEWNDKGHSSLSVTCKLESTIAAAATIRVRLYDDENIT